MGAAPPSDRCEACQVLAAQTLHSPMPQETLKEVQGAFEELLLCMAPGRKRDDVSQRVQMLVAELSDGRLPQPLQERVQAVAQAASVGDCCEASRLCAKIA